MGCLLSKNKKKKSELASTRSLSKDPSLRQTTKKDRELTLTIVGLDNAGKTVTAKILEGAPTTEVAPTIGFSSLKFNFDGRPITLYDLGGGPKIRAIWHNYFAEVYGLVFVIDTSKKERVEECKEVLQQTLTNSRVEGKPLLILANKQDISGSMNDTELSGALSLDNLISTQKNLCKVVCCSALNAATTNSKGSEDMKRIKEGFRWLIDSVDNQWNDLSVRVEHDVREQREKEEREKKERIERVRRIREERERLEGGEGEEKGAADNNVNPFKPIDVAISENTNKNTKGDSNTSPVRKSTSKEHNSAAQSFVKGDGGNLTSRSVQNTNGNSGDEEGGRAKRRIGRHNQVSPIPIVTTDEDVVMVMRSQDNQVKIGGVSQRDVKKNGRSLKEKEEGLDSDGEGWSFAEVRRSHSPDSRAEGSDNRGWRDYSDSEDGDTRQSNHKAKSKPSRRPNSEIVDVST